MVYNTLSLKKSYSNSFTTPALRATSPQGEALEDPLSQQADERGLLQKVNRTVRRETFYSPHKARFHNDYPKVEIYRDRGGE